MKILMQNKKAGFEYSLEAFTECGLVLEGWEVKSILAGKASLNEAYVKVINEEVFLIGCHISPLGNNVKFTEVDPIRTRKLLLKRSEISKMIGKVQVAGFTLLPIKIYYKDRRIKIEIALGKGKKLFDKREDKKNSDLDRELKRSFKNSVL